MHRTLNDVLEDRLTFCNKLNNVVIKNANLTRCTGVQMDAVIVWPDDIAMRYLELLYLYNTHFVPGGLPAAGMSTGDFVSHEGKEYLTVSLPVCFFNMVALHLFREHEQIFRNWEKEKERLVGEVKGFVSALSKHDKKLLGIGDMDRADKWCSTSSGWQYVGTPDPYFVRSLREVNQFLVCRRKRGDRGLARVAGDLADALKPFESGAELMNGIRAKARHKGVPYVEDDFIGLTSPTASGGASVHNKNASDNIMDAMPNSSDFIMVSGQSGMGSITHLGGGQLQGESSIMLLPKTPFFSEVRNRVDAYDPQSQEWQLCARREDAVAAVHEWNDKVWRFKEEVIKEVVPRFVRNSVLGFNMNLKAHPTVAMLRPVVAESALAGHEKLASNAAVRIIRSKIDDVLLDNGKQYGRARSVFDPIAA